MVAVVAVTGEQEPRYLALYISTLTQSLTLCLTLTMTLTLTLTMTLTLTLTVTMTLTLTLSLTLTLNPNPNPDPNPNPHQEPSFFELYAPLPRTGGTPGDAPGTPQATKQPHRGINAFRIIVVSLYCDI